MKIRETSLNANDNRHASNKAKQGKAKSPQFKSGLGFMFLNGAGGTMQKIQDGGFMASFLIQDGLGMTAPRTVNGFLRDKEVTGKYNVQEGFEVLGREGLTGPCIMFTPIGAFALASLFGKSTNVNSLLIKRFGNSLEEFVSSPNFDKNLLSDKKALKNVYVEKCINDMLKNTLGENNVNDKVIKDVIDMVSKYDNVPENPDVKGLFKKKKYKAQILSDITKYIDDIKYNTSSDLNMLGKFKVGGGKEQLRTYSIKEALDSLLKYSDDAIIDNKDISKLSESAAKSIKQNALTKRLLANIGGLAATLGILFVLPKIYLKSNLSPSAWTEMQLKEQEKLAESTEQETEQEATKAPVQPIEENKEISFKGKSDWFKKFIEKNKDNIISEFQFNGYNFTNTLMATLSIGGLLAPRMIRANQRAQIDENGNKDRSEIYEILVRDVTSSLAVVFAVPMLTRAFITSYEKNSGFVLLQKDRSKSGAQTTLDLLNPYSNVSVLTNNEIASIYNGIDSIEKMNNFCKYINDNNGDLEKIISKSDFAERHLENESFKLSELSKLSREEKNDKIIKYFEKLGKKDKNKANEIVTELMKNVDHPSKNKIFSFARGLNSLPTLLTTVLISPFILGWCIPRLTYYNTRKMHEKAKDKQEKKLQTNA